VDFNKARQAYFFPGIAAAFLSAYARKREIPEALSLAERFLELNRSGASIQYSDRDAVQICKYGWGVSAMIQAQPEKKGKWRPELLRMAHWFADWQNADGSWSPSAFLVAAPSVVDLMSKTAEHVMEINMILLGLGSLQH
jgi:hypothetical protein